MSALCRQEKDRAHSKLAELFELEFTENLFFFPYFPQNKAVSCYDFA